MPNWCNNVLVITHDDPSEIQRVIQAFNDGRLLGEFYPCPPELDITASPGTQDEELKALYAANTAKHGYPTWWEWCVAHWGTKWDVSCDCPADATENQGRTVTLSFDTAWAPPCGWYDHMMGLGFGIRAYYYEPGMCYVGKWEDGVDDYYEYGQFTSDTVREEIGDELDDMFCISENMAEWESENLEDTD